MLEINKTNFPDELFREYISSTFGLDRGVMLSKEELDKIVIINVEDIKNIQSLEGIEYFPNIEYLNCRNTGITSLDIRNNLNLKRLNCSTTAITELDISKNTMLEILSCNNTNITELEVRYNPRLEVRSGKHIKLIKEEDSIQNKIEQAIIKVVLESIQQDRKESKEWER